MQCANCARTLPTSGRFCPYCGHTLSVAQQAPVPEPAASQDDAARAASASVSGPARTGFAFQEFGAAGAPAPGEQVLAPAIPGAPFFPPSAGMPMMVPLAPGAGAVAGVPYGYAPVAGQPTSLSSPVVAAPPKRRGRSMGWIVLYAFLAIALLFTGLGVALHEIGAHVLGGLSAQYNAREAAAMQLYREVTSRLPSTVDSLQGPLSGHWSDYQQADYGCASSASGLRAYITSSKHLNYCLDETDDYNDFAIQVQMRILSGDAGGLVFRVAPDEKSLYMFQVTAAGDYALLFDKDVDAGTFSSLSSGTTGAMNSLAGQENTLMLIAQGNTFDVFINQQFVAEGQDATLSGGKMGVMAADDSSPTQVVYSEAVIWQLS